MHKWLFVFLLIAIPTWGQQSSTGNLTAASTVCASSTVCVTLALSQNQGGAGFTLSGTWSGTVQFEASADGGATYQAINATPSNSTTAVTSATGNGVWQANVAGFTQVRIRCSTFSSGTIVATINGSSASARTNGSGGAGAVSSVFTRTGAVVATSGDYTLDQIGNPAASKTFAIGTNTIGFSSAGTFTNLTMNDHFLGTLNSCSNSNIWGTGSTPAYFLTDTIAACVDVPLGSAVGFADALAGYAQVDDSGATGALGFGAGVGLFGDCYVPVNNGRCWGMNGVANDKTGNTGNFLTGNEEDLGVYNTSTQVIGLVAAAYFHAQPASLADAFEVTNGGGGTTGGWLNGFHCNTSSVYIGSFQAPPCVHAEQQASGNNQSSQGIIFSASDNSGAMTPETQYLFARHHMIVTPWPYIDWDNGTGNDKTWGVTLTATNNLNIHQLVKVDTANANSVVVCTTTDIQCSGFVISNITNAAPEGCAASQTYCGLATMPGSVVSAILGTGTCAIGNWVIVDTTTNGDVKCATTQPVAWQGFALAANSSVGTTFSVLVSPGGASNVNAKTYSTATNCAGVGTSASPSVASCGSAAAGQFSCATNATGATCTVNTTAVTANSEIFVLDSDTTVTGTRLGVTCNTSTAIDPVSRLLASSVAATSFTINLGTVTTNPACFSYYIIN